MSDTGIDTTGCEREPIHIPGAIQPHGALIALTTPGLVVVQAAGQTRAAPCRGAAALCADSRDRRRHHLSRA